MSLPVIERLAEHLSQNGLGLFLGENLFIGQLPSTISSGILVTSQMPIYIDAYTQLKKGEIQVVTRDKDVMEALTMMNNVKWALEKHPDLHIWGLKIHLLRAKHEPLIYPRSDGDLIEASVNFELVYGDTVLGG